MRQNVLGCDVDNFDMEETLQRIDQFIASGRPHQHVVINADKVVRAHRDASLRNVINRCDLINADGMPVVWAAWLLGSPLKGRVTGVDLFFRLLERAEQRGWRIYFLGAREDVVSKLVSAMHVRHPGLAIAGYRNGYWTPSEEADVAKAIGEARADILFVAISSPKKEEFLATYQNMMRIPFAMGVGGTFDVATGLVRRAPVWMQNSGLEWFYRFLQEPRRMFRRYFIEDMYFFWLLVKALLRRPLRASS